MKSRDVLSPLLVMFAFLHVPFVRGFSIESAEHHQRVPSRRDFLGTGVISVAGACAALTTRSAYASPVNSLKDGMSLEDTKKRFQAARKDLDYLVDNFAEISKGGNGDAVRNYLGTQGVNSNLFGIQKVLNALKEESDDIVDYTEAMEEFNAYYYLAEGAAYQSLFIEHSSAKGTPESFLATARQDVLQMKKYMDILSAHLNL